MAHRYFEDKEHAIFYKKYRQIPPDVIFEKIIEFLGEKLSSFTVAVDVGCGSGQSTIPLADHFEHVFGCDVSEEQIKQAEGHGKPNVTFKICPCENIDFNNSSVQLVTVSAALHWFNIEKFFQEADRILVPNGVLAIYSYKIIDFFHPDYPEISVLYKQFQTDVLLPNLASNAELNNQEYKTIIFPYSEQKMYRGDNGFKTVNTISLDELVGYLRSWSAYQTYITKNPHGKDELLELKNSILEIFKKYNASDVSLQSSRQNFLIMSRKPIS